MKKGQKDAYIIFEWSLIDNHTSFDSSGYKGAFNNYVDQILPNFDPLPPSSGQLWTFYMTLVFMSFKKHIKNDDALTRENWPPLARAIRKVPCTIALYLYIYRNSKGSNL